MKTFLTNHGARALVALALVPLAPAPVLGQTQPRDLARVSIEDLMKIEITSAAKKDQRAEDVPAAVFIITQDDIRRSGLHSLPELFRLVPGMQVARLNSNKWAVSAHGFNDLHSNKLLVLVDGRSIYNHLFSGVFWDGEDLLMQDIDRIEVIRGPGGALWGANAMNGVINIVTKSAAETEGTSVAVSAGTFERDQASIRHGGSLGRLAYRVYSQWSDHADSPDGTGASADDRWDSLTTGFRTDWRRGGDAVMAQGSFSTGRVRSDWNQFFTSSPAASLSGHVGEIRSGTIMGRWTHTRPGGSVFQVQAFQTTRSRDESIIWSRESIDDVELQYRTAFGARHDLIVGGGYRDGDLTTRPTSTLDIPSTDQAVLNMFVQDEISVGRRVSVTLGAKVEHNTLAGWGALPSARVMLNVTPTQRAWASVSRARRTPSAAELGLRFYIAEIPRAAGVPLVYAVVGNPEFQAEQLTELEGGYRFQVGSNAAFDVALFRGSYDGLSALEPLEPSFQSSPRPHVLVPLQFGNLLAANAAGIEVAAHWMPLSWWRLDGSYSGFRATSRLDAAGQGTAAERFDGDAPQHQWQIHSSLWPTTRTQVDVSLYHVGGQRLEGAEAYTRGDARIELKISERLSAIATGQNLLEPTHDEYTGGIFVGSAVVPRSGSLSLSWKF